jgi:hypothetical protein
MVKLFSFNKRTSILNQNIEPENATHIRIFNEGDEWFIDAADDLGNYTSNCWTHYLEDLLTRELANKIAHEFAKEIGCPNLPVRELITDQVWKKNTRKEPSMEQKYRIALLSIGAQHPAWSTRPDDKLVAIFNGITSNARSAVGAIGNDDDEKADWCSAELEKLK